VYTYTHRERREPIACSNKTESFHLSSKYTCQHVANEVKGGNLFWVVNSHPFRVQSI
jgi:hypothetical protein